MNMHRDSVLKIALNNEFERGFADGRKSVYKQILRKEFQAKFGDSLKGEAFSDFFLILERLNDSSMENLAELIRNTKANSLDELFLNWFN